MSTDLLIVDDDQDIRAFLELALAHKGFGVRTAADARSALEQARKRKPDVMIVDLIMPDMNGEELCSAVKNDPLLRDVIVFILSATADVQTKLQCFKSGAEEYLVKPVDPEEISARIHRSLKFRRPEPQKMGGELVNYGHYVVESLVGSGGMGQVYKGRDTVLERPVAIKVLAKQLRDSREFVMRFRREARLLASIENPGIATIYSFGMERDEMYFAMQWCEGGSLADWINNKGRIDAPAALDLILQCALALHSASRKGIVHRDIKPSNLMFDDGGRIKLVDFGLAFLEGGSTRLTDVSELLGTPLYMSPEQMKRQNVDHRSDIYSLGIVFYHLIYGATPFSGENPMQIILQHANRPLPDYQDLDGAVPYRVYEIIERMTQKDPDSRYQQYEDLIEYLERFQSPGPDDTLTEVSLDDLIEDESQIVAPVAQRISTSPLLSGASFFDILAAIYNRRSSGVLVLRATPVEVKLLISDRTIISFESNQQASNIWQLLAQDGYIKQEDVPRDSIKFQKTLQSFLKKKAFTPSAFLDAYNGLMLRTIKTIFGWQKCEAEFFTGSIVNRDFQGLPLSALLLEAARALIHIEGVGIHLSEDSLVRRTPDFETLLANFSLTPQESFLAYRIEGNGTSIETLRVLTSFPDDQILRFLFLLERIGAVEVRSPEKQRYTGSS